MRIRHLTLNGLSVTNDYLSGARRQSITLVNASGTVLHTTAYDYQGSPLLRQVSMPSIGGSQAVSATYSYVANSAAVGQTSFSGASSMYSAMQYDAYGRPVLVPPTPQAYSHDANGNLLSDGLWVRTWNAENRMTRVESAAGVPAHARKREDWTYLPDGRWIERIVWTNNGSGYFQAYTNRYVWDGKVLLAVLDHTNGLIMSFMRGLDLSGSVQGAGGVGGVLAVKFAPSTLHPSPSSHFVSYDGNGNVVALTDAATGDSSAVFEYGPFGELLRATGPMADDIPLRFSTMYSDDVTGDVKYLFRDLRTDEGRWTSRDPIGEKGGLNSYCYLCNHSLGRTDLLGLIRSGQRYVFHTGGGKQCVARIVYYSPDPMLAYNQRDMGTRVGAALEIGLTCDDCCSSCYKWRQHYTEYEDETRTKVDVLDSDKGRDWYPRPKDSPGDSCTYTFRDKPNQYPPPGMFLNYSGEKVARVVVSFNLELVKVSDCNATSGGTPVARFRWGFWYTRDANGLLNWD